jgi:thiol-disulfide isomerase/thioredoxin
MSNIVDAILNVIKPYYLIIMIVVVTLIFIAAGFYGYKKYGKPILAEDETKDVANANRRNKTADLYFFHVKWCPHCRTALPIWKAFAKDYDRREVNGVTVKCHDIDCTDDTDKKIIAMVNDNNIESYPTVKLILGDGTVVEFDAKIERSSLIGFLDTVLTDK